MLAEHPDSPQKFESSFQVKFWEHPSPFHPMSQDLLRVPLKGSNYHRKFISVYVSTIVERAIAWSLKKQSTDVLP